jgi:tRNA (adenine57-N1/adenine58-N1)-methyltransferase
MPVKKTNSKTTSNSKSKSTSETKNIFISTSGRKFYSKGGDLHTQYGFVSEKDIKTAKLGDKLKTNKDVNLYMIPPSFIDVYTKIKRLAQIIPLKDIGAIITETGMDKNSKVLDAGSGSGGLACFLAHLVKKMYTFDIRDDHIDVVKKNKEFLGLKNLEVKKGDIYDGVKVKDVDVMILDVPEPWRVLPVAKDVLKVGGFIVSYSPHMPQVVDFVNDARKDPHYIYLKTVEINEREWEIDGRKVRPMGSRINHSGFLSFARLVHK